MTRKLTISENLKVPIISEPKKGLILIPEGGEGDFDVSLYKNWVSSTVYLSSYVQSKKLSLFCNKSAEKF